MCNRNDLKNIEGLCGEGNAPDMSDYLFVTHMGDVSVIPALAPDKWEYVGDFTMRIASAAGVIPAVPAGKFQKWEVDRVDGSYDSGQKDDHYEPKFEFFVKKLSAVKTYILSKNRHEKSIVVFPDNNGKMRVMSNAELTFNEQTKSKNGYKCVFACGMIPDPLPFYNGQIAQ